MFSPQIVAYENDDKAEVEKKAINGVDEGHVNGNVAATATAVTIPKVSFFL